MQRIVEITTKTAKALQIKGLMNLQLAVKDDEVYMLEANPRASRTVPFVSKAIGIPLAKIATKVMLGRTLKELDLVGVAKFESVAVKASVFPFLKLPGVDSHPRPGDELHRRGHGHRQGLCRRDVQGPESRRGRRSPWRAAVYMTDRGRRQERPSCPREGLLGHGLQDLRHQGHLHLPAEQ